MSDSPLRWYHVAGAVAGMALALLGIQWITADDESEGLIVVCKIRPVQDRKDYDGNKVIAQVGTSKVGEYFDVTSSVVVASLHERSLSWVRYKGRPEFTTGVITSAKPPTKEQAGSDEAKRLINTKCPE